MGRWALPDRVNRLTTNRAESMNKSLKHFTKGKKYKPDHLAVKVLEFSEFWYKLCVRGLYGSGDFHLRECFKDAYDAIDENAPELPVTRSLQDIFKDVEEKKISSVSKHRILRFASYKVLMLSKCKTVSR